MDIKQQIADKLREVYKSEDYAFICPHCDDASRGGSDWADNIAALVVDVIGGSHVD